MEFGIVFCLLVLVTGLAGWGSCAAWKRGYRKLVLGAIAAVIALSGLFFYLSSIATGQHLAGLGEALVGIAILMGPGAGLLLGLASAYHRWSGVILGVVYVAVLASFLVVMP